jgi:hypothetical protein
MFWLASVEQHHTTGQSDEKQAWVPEKCIGFFFQQLLPLKISFPNRDDVQLGKTSAFCSKCLGLKVRPNEVFADRHSCPAPGCHPCVLDCDSRCGLENLVITPYRKKAACNIQP